MDGDTFPHLEHHPERVTEALVAGIYPSKVTAAVHQATELADRYLTPPLGEPLDARSWAEGLVYGLLWIIGEREESPASYIAKREAGGKVR